MQNGENTDPLGVMYAKRNRQCYSLLLNYTVFIFASRCAVHCVVVSLLILLRLQAWH
jgi:hypothetical protein